MSSLNILALYTDSLPNTSQKTSQVIQSESGRLNYSPQTLDKLLSGRHLGNIDAIMILPDCLISDIQLCALLDLSIPVFIAEVEQGKHLHCDVANLYPLSWPPDESSIEETVAASLNLQPFPPHLPTLPNMPELHFHGMYGISRTFAQAMRSLDKFSKSHAPVLINGETGTGKELAARYLHYMGPRSNGPFVPVNCGSLPDTLFENELFGHDKGAYTDAGNSHNGLIDQAQDGTLFLDEINSLCPHAQTCLLRFVQDQQYRALGSRTTQQANVSILAASNSSLEDEVEQGNFREDLFYRLSSISITLPALRDRQSDIHLLARHFLRQLCDEYEQAPRSFHPDSIAWLEHQPWPGNIRELKSRIHREFLINEDPIIHIKAKENDGLNTNATITKPGFQTLKKARAELIQQFEKDYLHELMLEAGGNVTHAARLAGKERRCLGKMLKKYAIVREDYI